VTFLSQRVDGLRGSLARADDNDAVGCTLAWHFDLVPNG
jgi:hypothetical protein